MPSLVECPKCGMIFATVGESRIHIPACTGTADAPPGDNVQSPDGPVPPVAE